MKIINSIIKSSFIKNSLILLLNILILELILLLFIILFINSKLNSIFSKESTVLFIELNNE